MRAIAFRAVAAVLVVASGAFAASHRNGPLLLEDQTANLNDFYIFRSWETGHTNSVVMSMSVQGFQNPDNGPSYYKFSNSVLYRFNVNNARGLDGNPDMEIDFVFVDTIAPVSYTHLDVYKRQELDPATEIVVTASGVQALNVGVRAVLDPGDEALVLTPAWPNGSSNVAMANAVVRQIPHPLRGERYGLSLIHI